MGVTRLQQIPGFKYRSPRGGIRRQSRRSSDGNLHTDIPPPEEAMAATRSAIGEDDASSWLPFTAVTTSRRPSPIIERRGGPHYNARS